MRHSASQHCCGRTSSGRCSGQMVPQQCSDSPCHADPAPPFQTPGWGRIPPQCRSHACTRRTWFRQRDLPRAACRQPCCSQRTRHSTPAAVHWRSAHNPPQWQQRHAQALALRRLLHPQTTGSATTQQCWGSRENHAKLTACKRWSVGFRREPHQWSSSPRVQPPGLERPRPMR